MRVLRHVPRVVGWSAAALVVLALAAVFVLTRTQPGVELVVRQGLERLEGSIDGTVTVERVDSPDLLEGARLLGLEIRDADGRTFARFDTLRFAYSLPALLRGDLVLYGVEARNFRVRLERLHGQDALNVQRIFGGGSGSDVATPGPGDEKGAGTVGTEGGTEPGGEGSAGGATGRRIVLRDVELSRGEVEVLLPLDEGDEAEGAFLAPDPGGKGLLLRRYAVRDLEAALPRVAVSDPADPARTAAVRRLSGAVEVEGEPVRMEELRGHLRLEGSRLTLGGAGVELPGSRARGEVSVDWSGEGVVTSADLDLEPLDLADLAWLEPGLPEGRVQGPVRFSVGPDSTSWTVRGVRVSNGRSAVRAEGTVRTAPELRFGDLVLDLDPVEVDDVRPWVDRELPVRGRLEGTLQMDGTSDRMAVGGLVALRDEGAAPTTARLSGLVSLAGEEPSVEGFQLDLRSLDFALLEPLWPERTLPGRGSVLVEADGSLAEGLRILLDVDHRAPGFSRSRIEAAGTVRVDSTDLHLDLDGEVDPLDLGLVRAFVPAATVEGTVEGTVGLTGPLGDLRIVTDLEAPAGRMAADARFDVRNPGAGYRIDGEVTGVRLSELVPALPDPTRLTGTFSLLGSGLDRETARGTARVRLVDSRAGRLLADSASVELEVRDGRIRLDTLDARTNLATFSGSGEVGLRDGAPEGRLRIAFRNDSLANARSLLLGDSLIVADTLSALEREVLQLDGVDPDTLPTGSSARLDGALEGAVTVEGTVDAFSLRGEASLRDLVYGSDSVRSARVTFSGTELPSLDGALAGTLTADSIRWSGRTFAAASVVVDYRRPGGRAAVEVARDDRQDYRARGRFELLDGGAAVHLDEMALRFEPARWILEEPATVEWSGEGLRVRNFRLARPDDDPMRIAADGVLPVRGEADFDLRVERLRLERLMELVQSEEEVEGALDLELRVRGSARRPTATASLLVDSLRFRNVTMSRVEGAVGYRDRRAEGSLRAYREGAVAARVQGMVPVDLGLEAPDDRIPDEEMDVKVAVEAFPAVLLATVTDAVTEVQGMVSGEVGLRGTIARPETSGRFLVEDVAFRIPALGIRPTNVSGSFDLVDGESVRVDLVGRARGSVRIRGTVNPAPLTDPAFDLTIEADGFQAVDRRDLRGRLGGRVDLTGTYRSPVVTGSARVQEGLLRIDELERSADVVDLSDPRFFDVVDTTFASTVSGLRDSENPFMRNLQLDVDLQVQRDTWLRGRDMNVEMRGDLVINWNRTTGDLVLTGQLNAVRGTYSTFQRQFQVTEGTIEFVGTPGLNPNLSISAATRIRTGEGEQLSIGASVSGTLLEPRVSLSSDAQPPIAESDLVSYLLFGRPSYTLAQGESQALQGAAERLVGYAGSIGLGALAQQLGSAAQEAGVDYFAISQAPSADREESNGLGGTAAATQVEAGWYLRQNVFVSMLVRPLSSRAPIAGVRADWQLGDVWTVEGFVEDRFSRDPVVGFDELGYGLAPIFGFFLYRDWGY